MTSYYDRLMRASVLRGDGRRWRVLSTPLCREHADEVMAHVRAQGFDCHLTMNGQLVLVPAVHFHRIDVGSIGCGL